MDKLDFERLYDESEAAGRIGHCSNCGEEHVLCWCGVCFKYCHGDHFHEDLAVLWSEAGIEAPKKRAALSTRKPS